MTARRLIAILALLLVLPAAAASETRVLYPRADGSLSPAAPAGGERVGDGTFHAPAAATAYLLAPGAVVVVPSDLLLERTARAQLYLDGRLIGAASAGGSLIDLRASRTLLLGNAETLVPQGADLSLRLEGLGTAGAKGARVTYTLIPAPPLPAANATPAAIPTPPANVTPTPAAIPTPAAASPTPASASPAATPTPASATGAGDAEPVAQFGFPLALMGSALPGPSTSLLILMLVVTTFAAFALVRLGRD